jgi:ferric-dicitrate binding protein FerR (iron transport regulator)
MKDKLSPQEELQTEDIAFYRWKWQEASDKDVPYEVQIRMLRQIKSRMKSRYPWQANMRIRNLRRWTQYAAVIIVWVSIGVASHLYTRSFYMSQTPVETTHTLVVSAEKGQRANIILPDGSKVWLNSHSQIAYPGNYGTHERSLTLTGEAYFEVAKDSTKRFIVKAGEMEVEALGTSFNIKAYKEDTEIITTLFSGSVQTSIQENTLRLMPEEYASFNRENGQFSVSHSDNVDYALMWRDNELAFERRTMEEIAVLLNRMYNVEIVFQSEKIKNYRFSGVIKNNSLDNVIELISLTAPIIYQSSGDTITLNEK